jgi:iron complex outermembrane receptor protein
LGGTDIGYKDYYHDFVDGKEITPLAIYNPQYGITPESVYPVYDRSKSLKERGAHYYQKYYAFYVQDEIHLIENKLRLTLAGRFTSSTDGNPYAGEAVGNKFTPRVGLSYSLDKHTSAYAVFDEAFIPQAGAGQNGVSFKPITGNNKEIGLKREWLGGLWTTSVALYHQE